MLVLILLVKKYCIFNILKIHGIVVYLEIKDYLYKENTPLC